MFNFVSFRMAFPKVRLRLINSYLHVKREMNPFYASCLPPERLIQMLLVMMERQP